MSREQKIAGKTKAGKTIAYRVPDGKSTYEVFFTNGGQVPSELSGAWTDPRQIQNAVNAYLFKDKTKPVRKSTK